MNPATKWPLVRPAAMSLMVGGLLSGFAVILAGAFAVLAPALAGYHGHSHELSFGPLIPAGVMLLPPILMFWTGRAMWRVRRWARMGGIAIAAVMIAVLAAAAFLTLSPDSPLNRPVGATSAPDDLFSENNGGLVFTALLFPFLMLGLPPVVIVMILGGIAAWPLSILVLLGSKRGKDYFA